MSDLLGHENYVIAHQRARSGVMNFSILDAAGNPLATLNQKHRSLGQRFWLARDWILNDQHDTTLAEISYRPNKRERTLVTDDRGEVMGRIVVHGRGPQLGGLRFELQGGQGEPIGVSTIPKGTGAKSVTFPVLDSRGAAVGEVRGGISKAVLKTPVTLKVTGEAPDSLRLMMLVVATITWMME